MCITVATSGCSRNNEDATAPIRLVHFAPDAPPRGVENIATGSSNAYFVLPRPPTGEAPVMSVESPFAPATALPDPIAGYTPFGSFVGPHPTKPLHCMLTGWTKDDGIGLFSVSTRDSDSPTGARITWDPAVEIGVLVTTSCSAA